MDGQLVLDHKIHTVDLDELLVSVVHKLVHVVLDEVLAEVVGRELLLVLDLVVDFVDPSDLGVETVHGIDV
eukprot:10119800-Prorocentrum_lima.AAC.1